MSILQSCGCIVPAALLPQAQAAYGNVDVYTSSFRPMRNTIRCDMQASLARISVGWIQLGFACSQHPEAVAARACEAVASPATSEV